MGGRNESSLNDVTTNDPRVSIIVPLYNSSIHITNCIDNIKGQSYDNNEIIIVVDSKCSDDTFEKVTDISSKLKNIIIIEQKDNLRSGGARNLGLDAATGDYVWFLDVDDYPHPNFISEMLEIISGYGNDVVVCNHYYSHKNKIIDPPVKEYRIIEMTGREAMEGISLGKIPIPSWNKLYRRLFLIDNKLRFSSGYSEDYDYSMHSFMNADKVIYYNKPLYTYVLTDKSRSVGAGDNIVRADVEETMKVADSLKGNKEEYVNFCAKSFRHLLRSMTNASRKTFRELSRTDEVKMLSKCKQETFSLEVTIYRLSPSLYYAIGRTARKLKFSKKNLLFDKNI